MPTCPFGWVIYDAIIRLNLSYGAAIDRINAARIADGDKTAKYDRTSLNRWLRGTIPRGEGLRWIASALEIDLEELSRAAERTRHGEDPVLPSVSLSGAIVPPISSPDNESATLDVKQGPALIPHHIQIPPTPNLAQGPLRQEDSTTRRRTLVLGTVAGILRLSVDPALKAIERIRQLDIVPGDETITSLEEFVADLGLSYPRVNAADQYSRIESAIQYVDELVRLDLSSTHRQRMLSVAGWLSGLAASAQFDLDDVVAARANCRAAVSYGKRAGDARLVAWASDRHAKIAFYTRDYHSVIQHAHYGLSIVPKPTGIEVGLLGALARAYARLGNHERAMATLREVHVEFDRLPASAVGGGIFLINEIYPARCASEATVWLNEPELTKKHTQTVIDNLSAAGVVSHDPTRLAIAHIDLATALAQTEKPDEASHFAVLSLNTERMVNSVAIRASDLDSLLMTRWSDVMEVREFHEQHRQLRESAPNPALPAHAAEPPVRP